MNACRASLHEIQSALVRLWSESDLLSYSKFRELSSVENQLLQSMPLDQLLFYAEGTLAKRIYFSKEIFRLTSKTMTPEQWQRVIEQYWATRKTNPVRPIEAYRELPGFIALTADDEQQRAMWADLADYELTIGLVAACTNKLFLNERNIPKNLVASRLLPVINTTAQVRRYVSSVVAAARGPRARRRSSTAPSSSFVNLVIYQDCSTGKVRVQQIGRVAAELVTLAQSDLSSFSKLYEIVRNRLPEQPVALIKESYRSLVETLHAAGIITAVRRKPIQMEVEYNDYKDNTQS